MKKNLFYAGTIACAMSLLASCNNEELNSFQQNDGFRVTAGMDVQSRTAVEDELNNEGEYDIVWSAGDGIYLYGGKSYSKMTLVEGEGNSEASFSGRIYGYASDFEYAIYPLPAVNADGTFGLELAAEKSWSDNSGAPMFGDYNDGHVSFGLLTAMFRVNVDVEAGETLTLTMTDETGGAAVIAGNATISTDGEFVMDAEGKTAVSVTFAKAGNYMLDIPVPAGVYTGYKVENEAGVVVAEAAYTEARILESGDIAVASSSEAPEVEEEATEIVIMNAAELRWFAEQLNSGNTFRNKIVTLGADIDLKEIPWTPAGNGGQGAVSFRGEFNGNNHSISNVAINCDSNLDGFFGAVWGATIKDLTLVNVSGVERGLLVAKVNGTESDNQTTTIENVTVNGSSNFKLVGEVGNDALVRIDGAYYVDDNESLEEVLKVSDVNEWNVLLGSGEYTLPYAKYNTINLEGENKGVIMNLPATSHENDYYVGTSLSFKNVTLRGRGYTTTNYDGYVQSSLEVYEDCKFEGYYMFAADEVTVTGCEFVGEDGEYIWTGSASEITFEGCKFSKKNRAVKVLTVGNQQDEPRIVKFNSCKFSADENDKAVLEGESKTGYNYVIYLNDCEMTGAFTKWFNDKTANGGNYTLYFNDKKGTYVTSAAELKSAMADADDGEAILLENGTYSGLFEFNANKHVTIQALNEKKAVINGRFGVAGSGTVDFEGLTFECKDFTKDFNHQYLKRASKYIICIYVGNVNVENCEFNTTVEGTGAIHQYAANNTLLVVKNSLFNSNGNYTLRTRGNVTVEDCTFDGMVRQCLQVMSNSDFDQNTTFVGNRITNAGDGVMGVSIGDGYAFNQGMTFEVSNNDASINNISYDPKNSSNILPSLDKHTFTGEVTTIVPETEL